VTAGALALVAAVLFALGIVLQQRGAMAAPRAGSAGFLGSIFTNWIWLAGGAAQVVGWVVQAVALDRGALFLVQPIISLQVVFALPLGIVLTGQVVGRREWIGAAAVVAGLAVFLATSDPSAGRDDAPGRTWLVASLIVAAVSVTLAVLGSHRRPGAKAAFFGTAAGVLFGFQAAVTKVFTQVVPNGLGAILHDWSTYALIVSALVGFYFAQVSLQAGVLAPAVATTNVANPTTSILLGRAVFQEVPARSPGGKVVSLVALALMLAGLVAVSRGEEGPGAGPAATVASV
jgi:drug/metabolite transporter (DMT)-like permease